MKIPLFVNISFNISYEYSYPPRFCHRIKFRCKAYSNYVKVSLFLFEKIVRCPYDAELSTIESQGANQAKENQGNQTIANQIQALFSFTSSQIYTVLGDTFRMFP